MGRVISSLLAQCRGQLGKEIYPVGGVKLKVKEKDTAKDLCGEKEKAKGEKNGVSDRGKVIERNALEFKGNYISKNEKPLRKGKKTIEEGKGQKERRVDEKFSFRRNVSKKKKKKKWGTEGGGS